MPSLIRMRKGRPPWGAQELGRVLARIADDIHRAVGAVDRGLRAELVARDAVLARIERKHPHVQIPEGACLCKDPHVRIRHDHQVLCTDGPRIASELGRLAERLSLPTAPTLCVPAFDLRPPRGRARQIIDVEASYAAIVREARARRWTPFAKSFASVQSVAAVLTGSHGRIGKALLALSAIDVTPVRKSIRNLAEVAYVAGSRLLVIAECIRGPIRRRRPGVRSLVGQLREISESLHGLDAKIREGTLFDPAPRGRHSRDVVYQEVVSALAEADFSIAETARLIVPTSKRKRDSWKRRVGDHLRNADLSKRGPPDVDSWGTSIDLGVSSRLRMLSRLT